MATESLPIGVPTSLTQNVVYSMPARACYYSGGGTLEVSQDGSNFTAIGTENPIAAAYIRNTGSAAIITLKTA